MYRLYIKGNNTQSPIQYQIQYSIRISQLKLFRKKNQNFSHTIIEDCVSTNLGRIHHTMKGQCEYKTILYLYCWQCLFENFIFKTFKKKII